MKIPLSKRTQPSPGRTTPTTRLLTRIRAVWLCVMATTAFDVISRVDETIAETMFIATEE
jgi:hypothetical protein